MEIIGFLCASVGSSTVQLDDSLGSRLHVQIQRVVSVVKMTTMIEECTTEEQRTVVHFLWARGLPAKDIHKQIFPVYG
jgi:hypothetical protein